MLQKTRQMRRILTLSILTLTYFPVHAELTEENILLNIKKELFVQDGYGRSLVDLTLYSPPEFKSYIAEQVKIFEQELKEQENKE